MDIVMSRQELQEIINGKNAHISALLNDMVPEVAEQLKKYPTALPYIMELKTEINRLKGFHPDTEETRYRGTICRGK